ncbi:MAG: RnfABCDGE type electron transport complex subunit G [Lachnospiraceae bacterium]|nr:RnfABCDGE type electron transport complex subunit G [Lachnospiraceae bacterium]MBR5789670.1 RnfABCDGE type electron transport complex subunit G [Lachnospiraceae bacterium]
MNRIINDTLRIFLITLIAGVLLGATYMITKEPIAEAEKNAKIEAYAMVFEDAADFHDDWDASEIDASYSELFESQGIEGVTVNEVITAVDKSGAILGYCITVTSSKGYGGDVTIVVGIRNNNTVNGISFLTLNETPGLGMKAKEESFYNQYSNVKTEKFRLTKTGANSDDEIDAISGATRTSNAVTSAVNGALLYKNSVLGYYKDGGDK